MCGRYYFVLDDSKEGKLIKKLTEQFSIFQFEQGEIFPSQDILILVNENDTYRPKVMHWGIELRKQLLINARYETAFEKSLFKRMQRCAIPCNYFYEWHSNKAKKQKYSIKKENQSMIYLAGLHDDHNVVILTGEAENKLCAIHHRTPLIMNHDKMKKYLMDKDEIVVDNENLSIFEADLANQISLFKDK